MNIKIALDTDVFISAFLFKGETNNLVSLWKTGKIKILISKEVLKEYIKVLSYPKFKLSKKEITYLIEEEFLSFVEICKPKLKFDFIKDDPEDNKFLDLAYEGKVDYIISGDKHLLELKRFKKIKIVSVREFLKLI
ncbi:MAG TPA: putative toxin-antitoxin system toxin component, PIN family [Candidatus Omnitrophica bacterium]|nr:putative toxin-antitoxin system toxin component, PIN family [Candidatus Omnitrophota bacterium]